MLTKDEVLKSIEKIREQGVTLRDAVQEAAVSIIGHAFEHGDVTLGDKLVGACGKAVDRQALVSYLEDHGPFKWQSKEGVFNVNKAFRKENVFDEAYLNEIAPWYEYGRDAKDIRSKFDCVARVKSVITGLKKAQAAGKEIENVQIMSFLDKAVKDYNLAYAEAVRNLRAQGDETPSQTLRNQQAA